MTQHSTNIPTRPEIPAVLLQLRGRIRRYVFWEGMAAVFVIVSLFFWGSLAIDYGVSVLFKLEVERGVRFLMTLAAVGLAVAALITRIVLRMVRDFRVDGLAMVLERRFPQLNDRLITSIQLANQRARRPQLTEKMLSRAVDEVADLAGGLPLRDVFDFRPLRRVGMAATLLAVSVVGFATLFPDTFGTWYRRNVILAGEYWPRDSELVMVVLAEPGERRRPFTGGIYKHPRGGDLTLLATVPAGKKVPQQVRLSYSFLERGGSGEGYFSKLGESQFKISIKGFRRSARLTISGGDFYNRRPYVVEVVDAPQVDRIVLDCLYPEHTGLNDVNDSGSEYVRTPVVVEGSRESLPVGTDFVLRATGSKALTAARIQTATFTLRFDAESAQLLIPSTTEEPDRTITIPSARAKSFLNSSGTGLAVPLIVSGDEHPELTAEDGTLHLPLPLPTDSSLVIELTDRDEVISLEPARLEISGIADESPVVETRPKGVRNSITRKATIPVEGTITDDYGLAEARFEYRIDDKEKTGRRPFEKSAKNDRKFQVKEQFRVLDLDLSEGQKLALCVFAADGDNLNGPHAKRGETTVFEIVSVNELLSLINARELNLRIRLEQILKEIEATRADLSAQRGNLRRAASLREATPPPEQVEKTRRRLKQLDVLVETVAQRSLLSIRKNANETLAIEEAFADIRAELINNDAQTQRMLDRIDDGILKPLNLLNTIHYNNVDEALGLLKLALDDRRDPFGPIDISIEELDRTIDQIKQVLAAMLKLQTINEARELLKAILERQEELKKKTEQERKRKLIESLK